MSTQPGHTAFTVTPVVAYSSATALVIATMTTKPLLHGDSGSTLKATTDDGAHIEPADWDLAAQAAPDFEVDQRINW